MANADLKAVFKIRPFKPINFAERVDAGEVFTEGEKRDAVLNGAIVPQSWVEDVAGTLGMDLPTPLEGLHDVMLLTAAAARCKPVAELTEREKVALVWATGGGLSREVDANTLKLTTEDVGFYNDAEGKVVVAYGPRPPRS